eukprot:comp6532_c0_seq1/m.2304 comp6532_c0_seq1/g.2304  ORF comp6532_c0_seq1/g.2304 comp6532_c0_seq1/m.2304 type:complete len:136 (-) comp6532_c0_seq1:417-824(-)
MDLTAEELLAIDDRVAPFSDSICADINGQHAHLIPDIIELYMPKETIESWPFQFVEKARLIKVTEGAVVLSLLGATHEGIIETTTKFEDFLVVLPYPDGFTASTKSEIDAVLGQMVHAAANRHKGYLVSQTKDSK